MRPRSWNPNTLNWPSWIHDKLGAGLVRIIALRHSQGTLPPQFESYVGMKAKNFPSIRSVSMAKEGWCMVECDYQTAEMRGLAYISGDEELLKLLLQPDTRFAKIDPTKVELPAGVDPKDVTIRLSYPDYILGPNNKDEFIMTYTVNKDIKVKVTEDALLRDSKGNIIHPKFDIHWGVVELAKGLARECLDAKKDRGGGKVANFCIAAGSLVDVLRDEVPVQVPIEEVTLRDYVWDGTNWVPHAGVVYTGIKTVYEYQGLWATANHEVWSINNEKIRFSKARAQQVRLQQACGPGIVVKHTRFNRPATVKRRFNSCRDLATSYRQPTRLRTPQRQAKCYDIVDAGINHRYTCQGILVSNSSTYGASANSIERKIEADIGVRPPPGTGQGLLDAIEHRQQRATAFLKEMEQIPGSTGFIRAASGRVRHCMSLGTNVKGLRRIRESQLAALGRECRNFQMQESVGATAARACNWLLELKISQGLRGYPMICLYDSVVIHCPFEEREVWQRAQELYMWAANGWRYHNRVLRYPIDTELNAGWSTKPNAELQDKLNDPQWNPTPEGLKYLVSWLEQQLKIYIENEDMAVH